MRRAWRRLKTVDPLNINRFIWVFILVGVGAAAFVSGERVMYVTFVVMIVLPAASYAITLLLINRLWVTQSVPDFIVKNEPGFLTVSLNNATPMPFGNVEMVLYGDEHAVSPMKSQLIFLRPFRESVQQIPFTIMYRGHYRLGLEAVQATDMAGLFRLRRKFDKTVTVTSMPLVFDYSSIPFLMNQMTQAHSRFDIRDEDYSSISDIRPYIPTDSIKRVHWKLTAKRQEWLVKIFQSNALNQVTMILDSTRLPLTKRESIVMEDRMVETALGMGKFFMKKGMPVDFMVTEGHKTSVRGLGEFEIIYQAAGRLRFEPSPRLDCLSILSHVLNDATGYVNAVILTGRFNAELYEKIVNAANNGHYIAVLYFAANMPDRDSERICRLLTEGGLPCFRIEEGVMFFQKSEVRS